MSFERDMERLLWAESGPTGVASGRTGVRAKAVIPLPRRSGRFPPKSGLAARRILLLVVRGFLILDFVARILGVPTARAL